MTEQVGSPAIRRMFASGPCWARTSDLRLSTKAGRLDQPERSAQRTSPRLTRARVRLPALAGPGAASSQRWCAHAARRGCPIRRQLRRSPPLGELAQPAPRSNGARVAGAFPSRSRDPRAYSAQGSSASDSAPAARCARQAPQAHGITANDGAEEGGGLREPCVRRAMENRRLAPALAIDLAALGEDHTTRRAARRRCSSARPRPLPAGTPCLSEARQTRIDPGHVAMACNRAPVPRQRVVSAALSYRRLLDRT